MHCVESRVVMSGAWAVYEVTAPPLQFPPEDMWVTLSRLLVSLRKNTSPHRSSREGANQFCLNPYLDTGKAPRVHAGKRQRDARVSHQSLDLWQGQAIHSVGVVCGVALSSVIIATD
ncbi:hypothetical protein TGCAST_220060 [Toxoplasma gondii CAST]|uniref:Uncharacterized protein n=2 Tax=Toxoplasma gondii TaxID=5811 RepID=A0A3R8BM38_TOXGO|nr:hypothetical protein TGCAST_220060 [Toxoplasma gondii CAST]